MRRSSRRFSGRRRSWYDCSDMLTRKILRPSALAVAILAGLLAAPAARGGSFVTFESGQVRPLALSPDGTRLFVVNTPDDRLEIFDVDGAGLHHRGAVGVGLEPIAVAARSNAEVWVVNHLSDSVSVVDVSGAVPRVVRTLLVGDEPRDIVFAGAGGNRAFVSTAHRGQQRTSPDLAGVPGAGDPQLTMSGVGRADVWVFNATNLGATLGGRPLAIVTLFGDTPRALATSPDGSTVYAAIFKSGNQTTSLSEGAVCDGFDAAPPCVTSQGFTMPGGLPGPATDALLEPAPETGLIVKYDPTSGQWHDPLGRDWSQAVRFNLPDHDVFAIDATTLAQTASWQGVGTTLFNMAVNPVSGAVYVSNVEARNEVRFEGPGVFGGSTVQGDLAEARVTILSGASVLPRHLNKHIDYSQRPAPPEVKAHSLALPTGMAVSPDGTTLYVTAFGSSKIGVFDTAALAADTFDPTVISAGYIPVTGGGPSGVVLDAGRHRLYVATRFDDSVSVVDLGAGAEVAHLPLHNPEPPSVVEGRPFLYDAALTSSNGEASCASCHIFGDMDDLAWDLGNPDAAVKKNPIPINLAIAIPSGFFVLPTPINGTGVVDDFHPMKGPMTTQTLRGLLGSGAMHWRGDRSSPPGTPASAFDEVNSFNNFNGAFVDLVGRAGELPAAEMQKFTDFALQITLPPNPNRALDNSETPAQAAGRAFFLGPRRSDGLAFDIGGLQLGFTCQGCHELDPPEGEFGTGGRASFENEEQIIKIPHLRNLYQKIGMFGAIDVPFVDPLDEPFQGDQVRGFGFLHDGSDDTLFHFLHATVFNDHSVGGAQVGFQNDTQRRDVEQFLLGFDSNLAPVVGQQTTLAAANAGVVGPRIDLLAARAAAGECDLIARGTVGGEQRGWYRLPSGLFQGDRALEAPLADGALRALAATPGQELTYTCVPPGAGLRAGVDRDEDGFFDGDERDAGTDPADATSSPGSALVRTSRLSLGDDPTPPVDGRKRRISFTSSTRHDPIAHRIVPPAPSGSADPTLAGATLVVYNSAGQTDDAVTVDLPAAGWRLLGSAARPKGYRFKGDSNGPITRVDVRADRVSIRGGRALWTYTLDEQAQGRVAVRLSLGDATGWCADAPARTRGNPPSSAKFDHPGRFVAARQAPPPPACPPVPGAGGGGSPSGAFLTPEP
jgi:YVTN family beta-propeller protein